MGFLVIIRQQLQQLTMGAITNIFFKPDEKKGGSAKMGIVVGVFAAFAGILYGYDTGTISGILAMDYVTASFPKDGSGKFTSGESSLIVSILSLGTFIGSLAGSYFADKVGRRTTIIFSTLVVFNVGVVLQTASAGINLLCAGRVIGGLGVGLISSCVPLYQAECTPKWIRGALIAAYQLAITLGLLIASCVNQATHTRNDSGSYRIPIAIQFLWALILGTGLIFLPESPRYFIKKGNKERALKSLGTLLGLPETDPIVVDEYNEIRAMHEMEVSLGSATWLDVFSSRNSQLKKVLTGCGLQALQQLTGINFIFYFGTSFFKSSGIKNSFTISLATNIVNLGMSFPGVLLIEILGRRNLLLIGSAGMCFCDFIVAIVGVASKSKAANQVLVAFACIFIAFFAATWGPICWVITGEIYPLTVRAKSIALATSSNWLFNFAIAFATPYLVDSGPGNLNLGSKVFFIWGACNGLGVVFSYFMIYETKGLSLEEIEEMYAAVPLAWKSYSFVPAAKITAADDDIKQELSAESSVDEKPSRGTFKTI